MIHIKFERSAYAIIVDAAENTNRGVFTGKVGGWKTKLQHNEH